MCAHELALQLEVAPVDPDRLGDRRVVARQRRARIARVQVTCRLAREEVRDLDRGQPGVARKLDGTRRGGGGFAGPPLQHEHPRLLVVEVRGVHAARGREHGGKTCERRSRAGDVARGDEGGRLAVIDLEQHALQVELDRDRLRFLHDPARAGMIAADLVIEREVHAPPDLVERRDLRIAQPGCRPRDELRCRVALRAPVVVVEQDRSGVQALIDGRFLREQPFDRFGRSGKARMPGAPEEQRDEEARVHAQRVGRVLERRRGVEQALEDRDPAVERREVGPFEVVAIDGGRGGEELAVHVAGALERGVRGGKHGLGARGIGVEQRAREPVGEARLRVALCLGHPFEPRLQRLAAALREQRRCACERVLREPRPVLRVAMQGRGSLGFAAPGEQGGGAMLRLAALLRGQPALPFGEQELAEQRMEVVHGLAGSPAAVDEEMPAIQVLEQALGLRVIGQLLRLACGHGRQECREHEQTLVRRARAPEDLAGEVGEDGLLALGHERLGIAGPGKRREVLAHQHDPRCPTFAQAMDGPRERRIEAGTGGDGDGLLGREAQRLPADAAHGLVGEEAAHLGRGLRACEEHHVEAFGQLAHAFRERGAPGGIAVRLVHVVDHEQRGPRKQREERAQVPPREMREIVGVLGPELRQARRRPGCAWVPRAPRPRGRGSGRTWRDRRRPRPPGTRCRGACAPRRSSPRAWTCPHRAGRQSRSADARAHRRAARTGARASARRKAADG